MKPKLGLLSCRVHAINTHEIIGISLIPHHPAADHISPLTSFFQTLQSSYNIENKLHKSAQIRFYQKCAAIILGAYRCSKTDQAKNKFLILSFPTVVISHFGENL